MMKRPTRGTSLTIIDSGSYTSIVKDVKLIHGLEEYNDQAMSTTNDTIEIIGKGYIILDFNQDKATEKNLKNEKKLKNYKNPKKNSI